MMEYILGGLSLVLLVILFFILRRNYNLKNEIKNQCGTEYDLLKAQLNSEIEKERGRWANENQNLTQQLSSLRELVQNEIAHREENIDRTVQYYKRNKEAELELHLKNVQAERITAYTKEFEEFIANLETQKTSSVEEVENLTIQLIELRSKYNTIVEGMRRQEEIENEKDFYRINLTDLDKEDIIELRAVSLRLHNREIINKLIWEVYYAKPYTELTKRVCPNKTCGIYRITNLKNNKSYIGKSTDIANRWKEHIKSSLDIGTIAKSRFHTILKDEGIDCFVWQILEVCEKDIYSSREHYWIDFYQTQSYGYNEKG